MIYNVLQKKQEFNRISNMLNVYNNNNNKIW